MPSPAKRFSELVAQKITEARLNGIACHHRSRQATPGEGCNSRNVPGVLTVSASGNWANTRRHSPAQRACHNYPYSAFMETNFSVGDRNRVCAPLSPSYQASRSGYAALGWLFDGRLHVSIFPRCSSSPPHLQSINLEVRAGNQRVSILYDFLSRCGGALCADRPQPGGCRNSDLQQVPGLLPTSQQFYGAGIGAPAGLGRCTRSADEHPAPACVRRGCGCNEQPW